MGTESNTSGTDWQAMANFEVIGVKPLYSPTNVTKLCAVHVTIRAPDGVFSLVADIGSNITSQILKQLHSCRASKGASTAIDAYIIDQAVTSVEKGIIFPSTGAYKLESGSWVFVAGAEILGECTGYNEMKIHPDAAAIRLARDKEADSRKAINHLIDVVKAHIATVWPTFCYTLISALRPQIMNLGLTTFPVLNIVGPQNYGKSRLNLTYNLLYDYVDELSGCSEVSGILSCHSTPLGILKELSRNRGQVVTLDELPISSEKSAADTYRKVITQALRFAANGSERQTAAHGGKPEKCYAGMAFTGEIPMTAASDLTRMIEVSILEPMTGGQASDRAAAAGAFREWIMWIMPHLDAELDSLSKQLAELQGGETARTDTTKVLLKWATELFFRMSFEMDIADEQFYYTAVKSLGETIDRLLDAQERKVSQIRIPPPKGNLSWYIRKAYHEDAFHIVPSRKALRDDVDCIVEDDALCIRIKTLLLFFRKQSAFQTFTSKQLTKRLYEEGVLPEYAEKRSAVKRIHGKRYLSLSFEALKAGAKQY